MSKTIAIITFKDMPDRRFKIKKSYDKLCGGKSNTASCAFFYIDCPEDTARRQICSFKNESFYFKEIKK